jgi:transposase-like protein
MEVFITKANADRIVSQMDLSEIDVLEFKREMRFKWFNNGELKKLKAFMTFFSDLELFASQYVKLQPRDSNKKFVFQGGTPAFHDTSTCERLNSDFKNIFVPNEIETAGRRDEYIKWCEEKRELFEKYPDQFRYRLKKVFNLTIDPFVHYENSGFESFDNYTLQELELAIEKKIEDANAFYNKSEDHMNVIDHFGVQSFNYKNPNRLYLDRLEKQVHQDKALEILQKLEVDIKQPLLRMLKNYYRMKNNSELKFDSDVLSNLGFNPCCSCCMSVSEIDFAA